MTVEVLQLPRRETLDRALRAHRHEHGRPAFVVREGHTRRPGSSALCYDLKCKSRGRRGRQRLVRCPSGRHFLEPQTFVCFVSNRQTRARHSAPLSTQCHVSVARSAEALLRCNASGFDGGLEEMMTPDGTARTTQEGGSSRSTSPPPQRRNRTRESCRHLTKRVGKYGLPLAPCAHAVPRSLPHAHSLACQVPRWADDRRGYVWKT